jgi:hypothetical protein
LRQRRVAIRLRRVVGVPANSFLHHQEYLGWFGAKRWRSQDGEHLYEWDSHHGHVEVYTKRGLHVAVFDGVTGVKIGDPVRGRKIDV